MSEIIVKAQYNILSNCTNIFLISKKDGVMKVLPTIDESSLVPVEPGYSIPPTFYLKNMDSQSLMDELWSCGFRPTEGKGSAGALAATEKHLQDMQKIAFNLLEIEK